MKLPINLIAKSVFFVSVVWVTSVAAQEVPIPDKIEFNRDIRPIFSDTCFKCHGFDANKRKKDLRMDTQEGAYKVLKSGSAPIVPGDLKKSEAYQRIITDDDDELMPPADSGFKITAHQKALIKKWIEQGGEYQKHWAFVTPIRPEVPAVKDKNWPKNPVDHFVLANLESLKLRPSSEADRNTLIRRATLDLTGLPPTAEEVDAFIKDNSPQAYEKVLDRLLASPRYGERMAMNWLDGARYADSHGYQADWERYQWPWRDWVINAYNSNQPFDQFTIDQIAGDMLPNATVAQKTATGFSRNHRINSEGGIIPEEWRIETVIDRVETTSAVWMGLTLGCCRCHDHKYDPITAKEFYQISAFFDSNNELGTGREKAGNHEPVLRVPTNEQNTQFKMLQAAVASAQTAVHEKEKNIPAMLAEWEKTADLKPGVDWQPVTYGAMTSANKAKLLGQPDKSVLVSGANKETDTYTIAIKTPLKVITGIRLEALNDASMPGGGPGRSGGGNFVLTDVHVTYAGAAAKLAQSSADFSQDNYPVASAIDGDPKTGWAISPKFNAPHHAIFSFDKPLLLSDAKVPVSIRLDFKSQFAQHQIGKFRISVTGTKSPHTSGIAPGLVEVIKTPLEKRSPKQITELTKFYRENFATEVLEADQKLIKAKADLEAFDNTLPSVMVMEELAKPRDTFLLLRGQYDQKGEKVSPGLPAALPGMPEGAPMNRLGFAKWLVDAKNPLTSRVTVNRFWEKFFGVGLVKTSENFGSQADWPSHPELLDWMATEFVRIGWDQKAFQKMILMSATYRQSSHFDSAMFERDPENRLLTRGPRFRIQAESVRDQALFLAGILNEKIGGPSVRPYQPDGVWDEINVYGNLRNYKHDTNGNEYRRSMYTIWKRTAAPPAMTIFDAPGREICVVHRSRTNTPLQALALLNDQTYVEASRKFAEMMIVEGGTTSEQRIGFAFKRAVSRDPSPDEMKVLKSGLEKRMEKFKANVESARQLIAVGDSKPLANLDPVEVAAYTTTASVILNMDETITKE